MPVPTPYVPSPFATRQRPTSVRRGRPWRPRPGRASSSRRSGGGARERSAPEPRAAGQVAAGAGRPGPGLLSFIDVIDKHEPTGVSHVRGPQDAGAVDQRRLGHLAHPARGAGGGIPAQPVRRRGALGPGDLCVTVDWASTSGGDFHPFEPLPGAEVGYTPRFCAEEPTTWQQVLGVLRTAPLTVLLVGGLYLLDRLLRLAVREGVHTRGAAARLRVLGWWLLLGSLVVETAASVAGASCSTPSPTTRWPTPPGPSSGPPPTSPSSPGSVC